jgi:hypothetical protein
MWTDGLTDMTKLIVVFRNFANAPKQGAWCESNVFTPTLPLPFHFLN